MEVRDTGQDNKIQISVLKEMILNKYLFQANKTETEKKQINCDSFGYFTSHHE